MKSVITGFMAFMFSLPVQAEFLAESDTGFFSAGQGCEFTLVESTDIQFYEDYFGYFSVQADFDYSCRTRGGRIVTGRAADQLFFPTLSFDSATQTWVVNGVTIAHSPSVGRAQLADGIVPTISLDVQEHSVTFKVQLERADPEESR